MSVLASSRSMLGLSAFQQGFNSSENAEQLITFDNIAHALAEYERSMVFR